MSIQIDAYPDIKRARARAREREKDAKLDKVRAGNNEIRESRNESGKTPFQCLAVFRDEIKGNSKEI